MLDQDKLCCSICLDLLKDPVSIPCGHSYCMNCIKSHWDEEDQRVHSCPQCRQTFRPRPVLVKNTMLADLVEELKKTGLQAAPADHCYAGPGDVACDFCTGRKLKALKSCLQCLVSYCEQHLQPHYESPAFKKHKLVMKIFCRTDQQCICYLCSMDEHRGHNTVSAAAEMTEKQREIEVSREKIQQKIQDREKDVTVLQQEVEAINRSADKAVEDSEKIFTELIQLIEKGSSDVKQQIRSQQETEVSRVKELQEKLGKEITELRRKDTELKKLSHTEDHIQFLQSYISLSNLSEATDSSSVNIPPVQCFDGVTTVVSELRDKLQDSLNELWTKIPLTVTEVDLLLPKTRAGFLKYSQHITLQTASSEILLSNKKRRAETTKFSGCTLNFFMQLDSGQLPCVFYSFQALSRESLTERCYWEVVWRGCAVSVAVTYMHTGGDEYEIGLGNNNKSWALYCFNNNTFEFRHNNIKTSIPGPRSSKVGVYLDHRAGILSFYSVSKTMTLLHRIQTTFTQPLYAGLWVYHGSSAELV
uniref:Tripartite motif-containing protein 16-like n=1 Tax=Lates calcarifer TaxID=8187 RepID=A0A4W6CCK3_LATCA